MWKSGPATTFVAPRCVEPEWLDRLRADDPRAVRSRGDLRRINAVMRNSRVMARSLLAQWKGKAPRVLLDLGSGDGTFMLSVARRVAPVWRNVNALLLDRADIVSDGTRGQLAALQWNAQSIAENALDFLERPDGPDVDVITANLFLHHLADAQLRRLLGHAARRARLLVACEPRRGGLALLASRSLWALGCNDVSRHDAVASVRAGFDRVELSALWPSAPQWALTEGPAMLFTHCFVARRVEEAT